MTAMSSTNDLRIFVSNEQDQRTLSLLLSFCDLTSKCSLVKADGKVRIQQSDVELEGLSAVCRYLILSSTKANAKELLGKQQEESAQVTEWLNLFLSNRNPSGDDHLIKLNSHLEDKMYIVGDCLTLADLIIFIAVYPIVEKLPSAQFGQFCNLLRWHDFIQALLRCEEIVAPIKRKLPVFDFEVSIASEPKKEKNKESKKGSGLTDCNGTQDGSETVEQSSKDEKKAAKEAKKKEKEEQKKAKEKKKQEKEEKKQEKEERKKEKEEKKLEKQEKKKQGARIDNLDLRVGKIVSIKPHPGADSLYIEDIDLGEEKPRQVVSGLVKFVSIEAMQNRKVVVCCNLKPATMRGVKSYGMVLCSSDSDHQKVDPLIPPEGVEIGERVTFEGFSDDPAEEIKPKQKIMEALLPDCCTGADGHAKYKDITFMTSKGPIVGSTPNGKIG